MKFVICISINVIAKNNISELISNCPKRLYAPIPIIKIINIGTRENNTPLLSFNLLFEIKITINGTRHEKIIKIVEIGSISLNSIILFEVKKI